MSKSRLETENLIDLHEKLNEFAEHYKKVGSHNAIKKIGDLKRRFDNEPAANDKNGRLIDEGYKRAFQLILSELNKEFIK